jgi:Tfp pilus assembly protein PilN
MIRINLSGEKRGSVSARPKKKKSTQTSEIEKNLILIIGLVLAAGMFFLVKYQIDQEYNTVLAEKNAKEKEYNSLKEWEERKLDLDVHREILTETIQKINQLKDRREGPVKLLEDLFNFLPQSAWLGSVEQGFDASLTKAIDKGMVAKRPGKISAEPSQIKIVGYARTIDGASNLTKKLKAMDSRYEDVILNTVDEVEGQGGPVFEFSIFLKMKAGYEEIKNEPSPSPGKNG